MKISTVFLILATSLVLIMLSLSTAPAQPAEGAPEAALEAAPADPGQPGVETAKAPEKPASVPEEPEEVVGELGKLIQAARDGNWSLVFVLGIVLLVWGARALASRVKQLAFLQSKWGGWGLVLVGTTAVTVASALVAGEGISWSLVSSALTYGLAAAAAHELKKDVKPA